MDENKTHEHEHYLAIAEGVDDMREMVRAMVAGFIADGFTEEQARAVTAGLLSSLIPKKEEE